jgi:hypothetical protein
MGKLRGNNGKPKAGTPSERFEGLSPRRWSLSREFSAECGGRMLKPYGGDFPDPRRALIALGDVTPLNIGRGEPKPLYASAVCGILSIRDHEPR